LIRLPPKAFRREDEGDDAEFYSVPRLEYHIDDGAIAALTGLYREVLPSGGVIIDLMSSWVSHLPADVAYGEVIGHGMNQEELAANPRLSRWFIQDLNRDSRLPLADGCIDAAMICVGVQYLQRPVEVLAEVGRILRPGAPLVISFSNRCFPTKAVAIWLDLDGPGHCELIDLYLREAGFREISARRLADGWIGDPMTAIIGRT